MTSSAFAVYEAYTMGEIAAIQNFSLPKRLRTNPFPPGIRRDEWNRGFEGAKRRPR
jgi:hypothetical protein